MMIWRSPRGAWVVCIVLVGWSSFYDDIRSLVTFLRSECAPVRRGDALGTRIGTHVFFLQTSAGKGWLAVLSAFPPEKHVEKRGHFPKTRGDRK